MAKANIMRKKRKTRSVPESLTQEERDLLKSVTTGHGKLITTAETIGINRHTIYNAIYGRPLEEKTITGIRCFLATHAETQPA